MGSVNFSVTFPKTLLDAIDKERGLMPRATYLQQIARNELKKLGIKIK